MKLLILTVLSFLLSCNTPPQKPSDNSVKVNTQRPASQQTLLRCNERGTEDGPEVSITNRLDFAGAENADHYRLKGYCSENRREVIITVNDWPLEAHPICKSKRWEIFLDLTDLGQETEKAEFKVSHGKGSNVVCKEIKMSLRCPPNYVPVPLLELSSRERDRESAFFCVMKYEAKLLERGDSKASSVPEGRPLVNISYQNAVDLCRNNGPRYDLISNDQWQTIARHIEAQNENWSSDRAFRTSGNILNCGVTLGIPKAASSDDEDSCSGTSSSCEKGSWSYFRRTHFLPNGYIIWDFCGSAGEIVKDLNTTNYSFDDYSYLLQGEAKNRFGPAKTYSEASEDRGLRRSHYWGLGKADLRRSGSLIIRGDRNPNAGVFSVHLNKDRDDSSFNAGFRCVFIP